MLSIVEELGSSEVRKLGMRTSVCSDFALTTEGASSGTVLRVLILLVLCPVCLPEKAASSCFLGTSCVVVVVVHTIDLHSKLDQREPGKGRESE